MYCVCHYVFQNANSMYAKSTYEIGNNPIYPGIVHVAMYTNS